MPTDKKKDNKKKEVKRTTSKDMPGSGMAKDAAKSIEERRRKMKELLDNI